MEGTPHLTCLACSHIARLWFEDYLHHCLLGVLFPGDSCAGSIDCRKNAAIALTPSRRAICPLKQAALAQQSPAKECHVRRWLFLASTGAGSIASNQT